jgi:DNA-binding transcriptional LysR family regulator
MKSGTDARLVCVSARPFEWTDLEIFLAVARGGSLTSAAESLGVYASTVQRRVAKLEAAARAKLFIRSQRGYSLTEAGQDLYDHALGMEQQATAAWRKMGAHDEQPGGTVRVATVDDLAVRILPPIIHSFREKHPRVTLSVDVRRSLLNIEKHETDIAVRIGPPPDGQVVAKHVARADVALYASRAYLKRHGRPTKLEDLRDHAIVRGDEALANIPMERAIDRYADPNKTTFRSNSFYARLGAIRAGIGIGFLGRYMGESEKALERLPFPFPDHGAPLSLLIHTDLRKNARVRAFYEHAYAELVAQRSLFEASE